MGISETGDNHDPNNRVSQGSDESIRTVFDNTFEFLGLLDPDGTLREVNRRALDFAGLKRDDVIGRPFWEARWWYSDAIQNRVREGIAEAAAGRFVRYEVPVHGAGESSATIDFSLTPVTDPTGAVVAIVPEGRDITEINEARRELSAMHKLLTTAIEQGSAGIIISDATARTIVMANPAAHEILGMPPGSLTSFHVDRDLRSWHTFHPDGRPMAFEELPLTRAIKDGVPIAGVETIFLKNDGDQRWVIANAAPVRDETNQVIAGVVVFTDVTERKAAESLIRRYADIVEHVQFGVYVYRLEDSAEGGEQLRMILANPAAAELTQVPNDTLIGRTIDECFPGLSARGVPQAFIEVIHRGEAVHIEDFDYGDDRVVQAAWAFNAFPLPDRCVGVAFEDTTARQRAQDALETSERRFRALFEHTNDAVMLFDLEGRVIMANTQTAQLLGRAPDDLIGRSGFDLVAPDQHADAATTLEALVSGQTVPLFERRLVRPDGSQVPVEVSASLVRDSNGVPTHFQSVLRDISDRKDAERSLRQAHKLDSLGVLAGGVAHDFNNLLLSVLGNAGLVLDDLPSDSPVREKLHRIEEAANRAAELTDQMLAYAGRARLEIEQLDVNEVITAGRHMIDALMPKATVVTFRLPEKLPPVLGDALQLRQVVVQLITNASEAMGEDGGTVEVTTHLVGYERAGMLRTVSGEPLPAGDYVSIEVRDDGPGMDEETKGRIFDPFFTTKFTGRGLGLAGVLGIVLGHGGTIEVDSQVGKGTTLRVLLPVTDVNHAPPDGGRSEGS